MFPGVDSIWPEKKYIWIAVLSPNGVPLSVLLVDILSKITTGLYEISVVAPYIDCIF